ncbi:MAG: bifunctional lysylphosphatidylglycerol flippase/synthetase MprF [Geminicoccaceae bacterium]
MSGVVSQADQPAAAIAPTAARGGLAATHPLVLQRLGRWLPHVVGLVLFALAIWVIHGELATFRPADLLDRLAEIPASAIVVALTAAALGYGTLTLFDPLALAYLGKRLPYRRTALASFTGYAFSHNLGLGVLSGGAVRYRLYTAWGLSSLDIGGVIAFNTATTTLGLTSILALACLGEPDAIAGLARLPVPAVVAIGLALVVAVAGYVLACALRRAPIRIARWQFNLPTPTMAAAQIGLSMLDWSLAAAVLYVLLPAGLPFGYLAFVGLVGLANLGGLISNVPGGIGVFEAVILLAVPDESASAAVAAALIAYRLIYYLLPLVVAVLLLGGQQLLSTGEAARRGGSWALALAPNVFALVVFAAGVMMLASGAAPAVAGRMQALAEIVPLGVIEISHFLASIAGLLLLLVAWGLRRRLDGAWLATLLILAAGIVLSLLRGWHVEQAAVLALTLLALAPCRRAFYRRAALFPERFSPGWLLALAAVLLGVLWLGYFCHRHVQYGDDLWWRFVLAEDAPRSLRATAGALIGLLIVGAAQLLRATLRPPSAPQPGDVARARAVIAATPDAPVAANLALLGDKQLVFSDSGRSFIMFGVHGGSWIALGEPVGPADERQEILWRFRELCDRYGARPAFYQVTPESMPQFLELGLTFQKLGEEALVPLERFAIDGPDHRGLRYTLRRLRRDGCRFEIVAVEAVPAILDPLAAISDEWLKSKNVREKGFSLGRFDPDYLRNFPVAVVRVGERIVAFANLWSGGDRHELSIDLMRYAEDAPHNIMEYLFVELMLWGKEQGYGRFSLGMVPLAGLERRRLAPLWSQAGAFLFRHGEHFYNFQGLLRFKAKFAPVWEPRYLAAPGGFALPRVLGDVTLLISGGASGLVTK